MGKCPKFSMVDEISRKQKGLPATREASDTEILGYAMRATKCLTLIERDMLLAVLEGGDDLD